MKKTEATKAFRPYWPKGKDLESASAMSPADLEREMDWMRKRDVHLLVIAELAARVLEAKGGEKHRSYIALPRTVDLSHLERLEPVFAEWSKFPGIPIFRVLPHAKASFFLKPVLPGLKRLKSAMSKDGAEAQSEARIVLVEALENLAQVRHWEGILEGEHMRALSHAAEIAEAKAETAKAEAEMHKAHKMAAKRRNDALVAQTESRKEAEARKRLEQYLSTKDDALQKMAEEKATYKAKVFVLECEISKLRQLGETKDDGIGEIVDSIHKKVKVIDKRTSALLSKKEQAREKQREALERQREEGNLPPRDPTSAKLLRTIHATVKKQKKRNISKAVAVVARQNGISDEGKISSLRSQYYKLHPQHPKR